MQKGPNLTAWRLQRMIKIFYCMLVWVVVLCKNFILHFKPILGSRGKLQLYKNDHDNFLTKPTKSLLFFNQLVKPKAVPLTMLSFRTSQIWSTYLIGDVWPSLSGFFLDFKMYTVHWFSKDFLVIAIATNIWIYVFLYLPVFFIYRIRVLIYY